MSDKPTPEETATWQRRLASQANNHAWRLSEQASRTSDEDDEMLHAAHAATYFWQIVGNAGNRAHAYQLLAHVHALLGDAERASACFAKAGPFFLGAAVEPWEVALSHAVAANVAAVSGNAGEHREQHERARSLIEALPDPEDRDILQATLRVVPAP